MRFSAIPRGWRVVLVVSLALNLGVLGIALGHALDGPGRERGPRMGGPAAPLIQALPRAERRALVQTLRQGPRPPRGRGLDPVLEALRATPFDPDALSAALGQARAAGDARLRRAEAALIERLTQMSPQARAAYAERLADGFRRSR